MRRAGAVVLLVAGVAGGFLAWRADVVGGTGPPTPVWRDGDHRPNVMVLLADDVGIDMIGAYAAHPDPPPTPRLDALAARGVRFRNAVANPVCSPTRATLLTGRYSFRNGVGSAIPPREGWGLPDDEVIIPRMLSTATGGAYSSAAVGKWHLSTPDTGGVDQPREMGFDHFSGSVGNLLGTVWGRGDPVTYGSWNKVVDGEAMHSEHYATSDTIDDAVYFAATLPEPWFMWVAFHAAHFPMHTPPRELLARPLPRDAGETDQYRAMVEALDTEIGRLFDEMAPSILAHTNIVFLGDNGSAPVGVTLPWSKGQAKGTLFRGGVRVPFIVAGPDVRSGGRSSGALINTTDLYATVADLLDLDVEVPADSVSFAAQLRSRRAPSARTWAYAEHFSPNGPPPWETHEQAIRDQRIKLLFEHGRLRGAYDLRNDPFELTNLLDQGPTPKLAAAVKRLRAEMPYLQVPGADPVRDRSQRVLEERELVEGP